MNFHIKTISTTIILAGTQLCAMDKDCLPRDASGLSQREAPIVMAYKQSLVNEQDTCQEFNNYLRCIQSKQNLKELGRAHKEYLLLNSGFSGIPTSFARRILKARAQDILENVQFKWDQLRNRYSMASCLYNFDIAQQGVNDINDNQTPLFNIMALLKLQNWLGASEPLVEEVQCMTKLLVDNGAKTDFENEFKQTALFKAAMHTNGHRMISILVKGYATVDHRDCRGRTPLIAAASNLNLDSLQELIKYGADKTLCDKGGTSALKAAQDVLQSQGVHRSDKGDAIIQLLQ